jgi:hypothetical protein
VPFNSKSMMREACRETSLALAKPLSREAASLNPTNSRRKADVVLTGEMSWANAVDH